MLSVMVASPTEPTTALVDASTNAEEPCARASSSSSWVITTFSRNVRIGLSTERSTEVTAARWTTAATPGSKAASRVARSARSPVTVSTPSSQSGSGGSRSATVTGTPSRRGGHQGPADEPAAPGDQYTPSFSHAVNLLVEAVGPCAPLDIEHKVCLNEQVESSDRLQYVVDELGRTGRVAVAELARETGSSEMTIRRDLDLLESQ